jgi:hypothetical protein
MNADKYLLAKAAALAKLMRLQNSPKFRSFLEPSAVEAFSRIEGFVYAGRPLVTGAKRRPFHEA